MFIVLFGIRLYICQGVRLKEKINMATANATRERSNKLYGLLAGLLCGRALQNLRAVANSDGYEAWVGFSFGNHGMA